MTLGGGSATFAETATAGRWAGKTLAEQAKARGYNYLTAKSDLAGVASADQKRPLLGLFAPGNLPVRFAPLVATPGGASGAGADVHAGAHVQPGSGPSVDDRQGDRPALEELGRQAEGFLPAGRECLIDKKDHAADACGQIGETEQMDEAVRRRLDFARKDGNTLVIVTADHAHTSQIVDGDTPGLTTKLTTKDGSDMIVAYGTSATPGSQQHTGSQVRVAGYGPAAANVVGLIDQTDLFFIMRNALGLNRR